jgi:hypothetical protein
MAMALGFFMRRPRAFSNQKSTFLNKFFATILLGITAAVARITFHKEQAFSHDDEFMSLSDTWNWIHHGELASFARSVLSNRNSSSSRLTCRGSRRKA